MSKKHRHENTAETTVENPATAELPGTTVAEMASLPQPDVVVVGNTVVVTPPVAEVVTPVYPPIDAEKYNSLTTWAARYRFLNAAGFSRSQIAKFTGKIYQHVRNVLITPVRGD